jgi:SAM-dependent methyltransferase
MKLPAISLPALPSPTLAGGGGKATLLDAEKAALWRAKFKAWWDGVAFDPEAHAAGRLIAQEEAAARKAEEERLKAEKPQKQPNGAKPDRSGKRAKPDEPDAQAKSSRAAAEERDLFDAAPLEPETPRIAALMQVWGTGRTGPGDDHEDLSAYELLGAPSAAPLAVLGPGGISPIKAIGKSHRGPVQIFEWRDEALGSVRAQAARLDWAERANVRGFELDSFLPQADAFAGVLSFDELSYCARPGRFCQQLARMLTPAGSAVVITYCRRGMPDLRAAFATAFGDPTIQDMATLEELFENAGLSVEAREDVTDAHLAQVRAGFRRLGGVIETAAGLAPEITREIGWEAEAWRARVSLLSQRSLTRWRFILARRPL